ncbi:MAG TPA: TetR/AcrR family transcriptional regulator [Ktedonobacterales bacterium]|nr:TetR/AcrR family transcriptional regulator [Ktedonobacterales bacterium]
MTTPPTGTRSSLKEKQREEREKLILQTAEEVMAEKGYHDTSMDEIALRVGISKGTLYLHFASKEDLLLTLILRYAEEFLQEMGQVFALTLGPRAKLEAILRTICGSSRRFQWLIDIRQNPEMQKIFRERHEHWHQLDDKKHESFHQIGEQLMAEVRTLLEAGKTTGEFDASVPTDVMLSAFLSLLSPLVYQRLLADKQMSPDTLAEYLGRIYFHGITTH